MWNTPFAILPVHRHARITAELVQNVERSITLDDGDLDERAVRAIAQRIEARQPVISARLTRLLRGSRDEAAVALGYFLLVCVFAAFDRAFGERLTKISQTALEAVFASLKLEAELRAEKAGESLEVEDVIAAQQPALFAWVADHTESTLAASVELGHVNVNDIDAVLTEVAAAILALSYAVPAPPGVRATLS